MNTAQPTAEELRVAYPTIPLVIEAFQHYCGVGKIARSVERKESPGKVQFQASSPMYACKHCPFRKARRKFHKQLRTPEALRFIAGLMGCM